MVVFAHTFTIPNGAVLSILSIPHSNYFKTLLPRGFPWLFALRKLSMYVYKSGEIYSRKEDGFDIVESTVARACLQPSIDLSVQAKREIGKLWDNIEKAPYKILFNPSVNSLELWRAVLILRIVEEELTETQRSEGRERLCAAHGNRFVTHLVYKQLSEVISREDKDLTPEEDEKVRQITQDSFAQLVVVAEKEFPDSYLASVFKNSSKCKVIHAKYFA